MGKVGVKVECSKKSCKFNGSYPSWRRGALSWTTRPRREMTPLPLESIRQ